MQALSVSGFATSLLLRAAVGGSHAGYGQDVQTERSEGRLDPATIATT
jgi:hypothetical protein